MMLTSSPTKGDARFHSNGFPSAGHPASTQFVGKSTAAKRLASCREELELSWGLRCVSNDDDSPEGNTRNKRRKTVGSNCSNNDDSMMIAGSFVAGKRITPWSGQIQQQQQQAAARAQVKAGWYEGEVDALGNRHGKGTTKHDDGTEYEGPYFEDVMEGPRGRYQFPTARHPVPDPRRNGSHLQRRIEKSYLGSFKDDLPDGAGVIVAHTTDWDSQCPQVPGLTPVGVRFMEVAYDAGMHASRSGGRATGMGVRVVYTATVLRDSSSALEMTCFRLMNGEDTNLQVAPDYAKWMHQCMGLEFPSPPS